MVEGAHGCVNVKLRLRGSCLCAPSVWPLRGQPPPPGRSARRGGKVTAAARQIDRTLAALADPHRRRVIDLLRERPRPAGELARDVGLTPPAMSRHLRTLRQSGLVEE